MKSLRIGILCVVALLCLCLSVPAFAADPPATPTTSVSVVVVSPGNVNAGVGITADNVNLGIGVDANTSNITVNGKSTASFNISGGNASTINLNNSNLQDYIGQVTAGPKKGAGVYEGSWQESTDKIRNQVYPAVNQINTNLNLMADATVKLIQHDQLSAEDIKILKVNVATMQADSIAMQQAIAFLASYDQDQIQEVSYNQSMQNAQIVQQAATIAILQSQTAFLTNKVQVLEQAKYVEEHSGLVYNVKSFIGSIAGVAYQIWTSVNILNVFASGSN
jgi:hypothetical protein